MKDNKSVLNEAFFKKSSSYSEKVKSRMPAYEPVSSSSSKGFGSQAGIVSGGSFAVSDADEMKKRLTGTFGAAFGGNNIKAMAGKAIKSFPIIVSDNIEPETVINLKRLMEEQYADYISLLISNKVIDIGEYTTGGDDGSTIAIQALDSISGTDFSKNRLANKAMNSGELSVDDIGANTPLYNLLREEHIDLKTGDSLFDSLMENALVVPSDKADELIKYIQENADSLILQEEPTAWDKHAIERSPNKQASKIEDKEGYYAHVAARVNAAEDSKTETLSHAIERTTNTYDLAVNKINGYDKVLGAYSGKIDNTTYNKLSNAEILVDKAQFDNVMNRTVGELLMDPKNHAIKDRFEKAAILLQAEMITGSEFIDYCTLRLGIPISATARATLVTRFKRAKNLGRVNNYQNDIFMTDADAKLIKQNQKIFDRVCPKITNVKIGGIVSAIGGAAGGAVGGAILGGLFLSTMLWPAVIAAAVSGTGAYLIYKLASKKKIAKEKEYNRIEGWERVEMLIERMDKQRAAVISSVNPTEPEKNPMLKSIDSDAYKLAKDNELTQGSYKKTLQFIDNPLGEKKEKDDGDRPLTASELEELQNRISLMLNKAALTESVGYNDAPKFDFSDDFIRESVDDYLEAYDECMEDPYFKASQLEESLKRKPATTIPTKVKYVEKKPKKDILIVPEFSARSQYAYGSTEIDSRAMKDRKYNQPLIMTIKFKERLSDDKYSDNELVAVIGILGRVIRVPSNEMKYILTRNVEGETVEGIFKSGNIKNTVSELLSTSKINADVRNLPQSADVWKNLEKVAALAIANKYSGRKSGNVANAHIVFSEKEIDDVRIDTGTDYKRDMKLVSQLMRHYSAFTLMIADDPAQRVYIYNDEDDISWNVVPYSAIMGKDTGDQLASALSKISRI